MPDEPRRRIHNAAAPSSVVKPSATFVSSASISKSNRVGTEEETDPAPFLNAKSTRKEFRLGHILGAAFLITLFVYDLLHNNGSALGIKFSDSQGLAGNSTSYSPTKSCLDPFPEFEDIEITPSYVGGPFNMKHPNQIAHLAEFGLGHRLSKISSAWHLTKALNLTRMVLFWGDCRGEPTNIAPGLFGSDTIDVPGSESEQKQAEAKGNIGKTIKLKNDVTGYYSAQTYKSRQIPLPKSIGGDNCPWLSKYKSDVELYRILLRRFVGKGQVMHFMSANKFKEHFVIGLHLRLGNGEKSHFEMAGRGVKNELEFVHNLLDLLKKFVKALQDSHPQRFTSDECSQSTQSKEPLIFLATDSPKYIPLVSNYTKQFGIETVVMPQIRVEKGVTFTTKGGAKCAKGWYDMMLDDILLSFSDVLVAARHSTFTQSMPMPLVFDRNSGIGGPHFCEVNDEGTTMTCLEDMRTWLFRDNPDKTFTYSIEDSGDIQEVIHRVTVHFPDIHPPDAFSEAVEFIHPTDRTAVQRTTVTYGENSLSWFDMKYRKGKESCPMCTSFVYNSTSQ